MKIVATIMVLLCSAAHAQESGAYLFGDLGYTDTSFTSGVSYDAGAGFGFTDNFAVEVAYNDYGDVGPFDIGISSVSFAGIWGGQLSNGAFLYGIFGVDNLDADDSVSLGFGTVSVDESSTEPMFGIGTNFQLNEKARFRIRLVGHDSGDILTLTGGVQFRL